MNLCKIFMSTTILTFLTFANPASSSSPVEIITNLVMRRRPPPPSRHHHRPGPLPPPGPPSRLPQLPGKPLGPPPPPQGRAPPQSPSSAPPPPPAHAHKLSMVPSPLDTAEWLPLVPQGISGGGGDGGPGGRGGGQEEEPSDELLDQKFLRMVNMMDNNDRVKQRSPSQPSPLPRPLVRPLSLRGQNSLTDQVQNELVGLDQNDIRIPELGVNAEGETRVIRGHGGGPRVEEYHSCYRQCSSDPGSRMTCSFNFTVANYYILSPHCFQCPNVTMDCDRHGCVSGDGRQRPIAVVNKMMPGPAIRVCEGDTVVVDVTNKLIGQETTIHWHGILQQSTPWSDGVPHVTQCPIPEGETFRYQFDTPRAGTYFWHSHSGVQRADGVAGIFIVRKAPEVDVQAQLYDFDLAEHEIIFWDWLSGLSLAGYLMSHVLDERELPQSILVNGKGFPPKFFDDFYPFDTIQTADKPFVPIHEVRIRPNFSYRFRLISNGVTMCPIEFSIEQHSLLVIASDSGDIVPVEVQSLVIYAGERFDVVVRGDQQPGSYWMKFRGLIDCNMTQTFQLAVLNYEGTVPGALPDHSIRTWPEAAPSNPGLQLNSLNVAPGVPGQTVTVAEVSSVVDDDPQIIQQAVADHQFYLGFDFYRVPNVNFGEPQRDHYLHTHFGRGEGVVETLFPQLNFITHAMPMSPPLTQPETIPSINRCDQNSKEREGIDCTRKHCKCVHWLQVKLNSIVELVLVDMGITFDAAHPFHLHGHAFRVVSLERVGNTTDPRLIQEWDAQGLIPRRRASAPIKDTVYVPDGGYTILRFRANNPGIWFFHCHIMFHSERGMGLIIQVGEPSDVRPPPAHFPRCGNYIPPVEPSPGGRHQEPFLGFIPADDPYQQQNLI